MNSNRRRRIARLVVFVLPAFLVLFAGLVWVVRELWNWLMPSIFGVHAISYWQALGLMALSWILFRGFRGPRFMPRPWRHGLQERLGRMTPEEREEFFKGVRSRCGGKESPEIDPKANA